MKCVTCLEEGSEKQKLDLKEEHLDQRPLRYSTTEAVERDAKTSSVPAEGSYSLARMVVDFGQEKHTSYSATRVCRYRSPVRLA